MIDGKIRDEILSFKRNEVTEHNVYRILPFRRLFLEMLCISLGVAAVSFVNGWAARTEFNVQV